MDLTFPYKHIKNPSISGKTVVEHELETEKNPYTIKDARKISLQLSRFRGKKVYGRDLRPWDGPTRSVQVDHHPGE